MKLFIYIFKLIIFTFYLTTLLPYFSYIFIINILSNLLPPLGNNKPDWVIKVNTHFIFYSCNILLKNSSNYFLIYFILKLQTIVLHFGINTGLILCRSQSIHQGKGLLLKFQAYPQPLKFYNVYFAIWFTLIQESQFLNNDTTQVFISTMYASILWNSSEKFEVGDYKPGLCSLISDVKTPINIQLSDWWTLHSNFTWDNDTTIIDYIRAIIPYHDKLINSSHVSISQTPWINEVHITSWKVSKELNPTLIKRHENSLRKLDWNADRKSMMR
jgi:hypothetical protein